MANEMVPRPEASFFQPKNVTEAMQVAKMIAASSLCPLAFRGKPGDVLIAMMHGQELGVSCLQAIQGIAVINGRPTVWGDLVVGLIQRSGQLEYLRDSWDEAAKTSTVHIKRIGRDERVSRFSWADAVRAKLDGKDTYKQYPQRMLMWRAKTFAIRDEFADVLRGLTIAEEAMDLPPVERLVEMPQPVGSFDQLVAELAPAPAPGTPVAPAANGPPETTGPLTIVSALEGGTGRTKANRQWTRWDVELSDGRKVATFSKSVFEAACAALAGGLPVTVELVPGKEPGHLQLTALHPVAQPDDAAEAGAEAVE